jgi:hypothetical protein
MHFKSNLHVRDHSKATGTAHHLLQTIAQHVNMHTGEAFGPSVDRLAARLDVTPQWVRQLRARLVAEGELILKPSRGRHPNVYIIPYERCPACQGVNPKVELPDDPLPDDPNPQVEDCHPASEPETLKAPTRNSSPSNPQVADLHPEPEPETPAAQPRHGECPNPKLPVCQPETLGAPTRNSGGPNPKLREPFASILARIESGKDFKEVKEKKEMGTRKFNEHELYRAERLSPFWCEAHGFCHSERLEDHRPDCARER